MDLDEQRETPEFVAVGHTTVDLTLIAAAPPGDQLNSTLRAVDPVLSGDAPRSRALSSTASEAAPDSGGSPPSFGGTAAFAALTAKAMGVRAAVVTSAAPGYPFDSVLPGIPVHVVSARRTTTFRNIYGPDGRQQFLVARAAEITRQDVPANWLKAPVALIAPLARELPTDTATWFEGGIIGVTAQGWLRQWDEKGRVSIDSAPPEGLSSGSHVIVASVEEIARGAESAWVGLTDVLAVTEGAAGARVLIDGQWRRVPAPRVPEVDPTGAGDVWAAAYLIRFFEIGDPLEAARFASCAASLSVTAPGLSGIPTRAAVEAILDGLGPVADHEPAGV